MQRPRSIDGETRRWFLGAVGLAGLAGGFASTTAGRGTPTETGTEPTDGTASPDEAATPDEEATPILLGGEVNHWFGLAPTAILGEENPTLRLQAGERYRLVWMNLDGVEHELIVEDADGEELVATEAATRAGATRSVTFTASEEMAEYYCEYHPQTMRGDVELGEGFATATEVATAETESPTEGDGSGY